MNEGGKVVDVWLLQEGVIGIKPLHRLLQRPEGVKAAGLAAERSRTKSQAPERSRSHVLIGLMGGGEQVGPCSVQEGEVAHIFPESLFILYSHP